MDPERVVKPWTPLVTGEKQVSAWGRTMSWSSSLLPDSIVSSGEELLAAPAVLRAGIGAEIHTFRLKSFRFLSQNQARAVAEAAGDICDVEAVARITADFDGFLWFELSLKNPARNVTFSWLRAEFPLRPSQMRLYQTFRPGADGAGAIGSSPIQLGWLVNDWVANFYHWFGNEDRGIGFTYSTLENWKPASLSNFCTFVPGRRTRSTGSTSSNPRRPRMACVSSSAYRPLPSSLCRRTIIRWWPTGPSPGRPAWPGLRCPGTST